MHLRGIRTLDRWRRVGVILSGAAAAAASVLASASISSGASADLTARSGCSAFGPSWARSYNARAIVTGNPVRILGACCQPTEKAGVNHCFVTVTLAGTIDRGCELVDIGPSGLPAGPGRHERCAVRQQTA